MPTETKLNQLIRTRLIEEIKISGLSQSEIAKRVGISSATLSDYIHKGKLPSLETFAKLCKTLDCDSNYILNISN